MKARPGLLVVDASILIAAITGRGPGLIEDVARSVKLCASARAIAEVRRRIALGLKRPDLLFQLDRILRSILVVADDEMSEEQMEDAATTLQLSVQSKNGSTGDAHILALAWAVDTDIWSTDRDFAGTGTASWSTPNLLRAIAWSEATHG